VKFHGDRLWVPRALAYCKVPFPLLELHCRLELLLTYGSKAAELSIPVHGQYIARWRGFRRDTIFHHGTSVPTNSSLAHVFGSGAGGCGPNPKR
jgi:hypothetical protein